MDKKLILAVAGSGKTTHIINNLDSNSRSLIITYTNCNFRNLREGILHKFDFFPPNITLFTYFSFLYSFCFRPFLSDKLRAKGITFDKNPNRYVKQGQQQFFMNGHNRIYSNRIAKLLDLANTMDDVRARLLKYFDCIYMDEVQDLAGHDFNFLKNACQIDLEMILVGDFFQHTFDTSRDGTVNKNLYDNYENYKNLFDKMGFSVDTSSLKKSHRCSPVVCDFITNQIGIEMYSHNHKETAFRLVESLEEAKAIYENANIVKLFYEEHYKYNCFSKNWGDSKGEDKYNDICVVLNKTTFIKYQEGKLAELKPQSRNKLYVACSRANGNIFFVSDEYYKNYKC